MEEPAVHAERALNAAALGADSALDTGLLEPRPAGRSGRPRVPTPKTGSTTVRPFPVPALPVPEQAISVVAGAVERAKPPIDAQYPMGEYPDRLSRVINVLIAAIALLLLAPVQLLVAVAVKLTSEGPIFYTQTRIGRDRRGDRSISPDDRRLDDLGGQPFTILKFRSMRVDAEASGQAVWATKHDSRVTPIGHILRKTRLDELPQLMNVLRGDMNIVGPRPERPSIVVRLRQDIPEYPLRHRVKPGITGWAQINHSYDSSIEDVRTKVRYDLAYIAKRSLWFDLKIMVMTIPVMLFRRGAH
jgi:lipopolysaccharide/colanic/teichoic acid biosynthesis glycosyltransferase